MSHPRIPESSATGRLSALSAELGALNETLAKLDEELKPKLDQREELLRRQEELGKAIDEAYEAVRGPALASEPNNKNVPKCAENALTLPENLTDAVRKAVVKNQAAPYTTQIVEILKAAPRRHWTIDQLMALLQPPVDNRNNVMATLSHLYKHDRIDRPGRGRYKHAPGT